MMMMMMMMMLLLSVQVCPPCRLRAAPSELLGQQQLPCYSWQPSLLLLVGWC